jgi:hypothetical protein
MCAAQVLVLGLSLSAPVLVELLKRPSATLSSRANERMCRCTPTFHAQHARRLLADPYLVPCPKPQATAQVEGEDQSSAGIESRYPTLWH